MSDLYFDSFGYDFLKKLYNYYENNHNRHNKNIHEHYSDWLQSHCKIIDMDYNENNSRVILYFATESDLITFKLVWL